MAEKSFVALGERGLLAVAGEDRRDFTALRWRGKRAFQVHP